jgi:hypothetical protein
MPLLCQCCCHGFGMKRHPYCPVNRGRYSVIWFPPIGSLQKQGLTFCSLSSWPGWIKIMGPKIILRVCTNSLSTYLINFQSLRVSTRISPNILIIIQHSYIQNLLYSVQAIWVKRPLKPDPAKRRLPPPAAFILGTQAGVPFGLYIC